MSASESGLAEELLRRSKAGCQAALGRLLVRYGNYLALLARLQVGRRLQGKVDASDLVQETFLKAHRDFATFRGASEAEFLGWLRQILATTLAGSVRRYLGTQRRNLRLERQLTDEIEQSSRAMSPLLASPQSTPSQQASRREQAVLLADALSQLPKHYREVIILHHLEGHSLAESARRMERSEDSVQKLWARALIQLRQALGACP